MTLERRPTAVVAARPETTGHRGAPIIDIAHVDKIFVTVRNERIHALSDISLTVADREFVTIVGPSGCGKSTLLKILAGLLELTKGNVTLDGTPVKSPRRDIGMMFQSPVLLPWRTIIENIMLPVEVQGLPKDQKLFQGLLDERSRGQFAERPEDQYGSTSYRHQWI